MHEVAENISRHVTGTAGFLHHQGCCQTPVDIGRVNDALTGLGKNPNFAALLLVSLGCESTAVREVAEAISDVGKRVETIVIQEVGGAAQSIAQGVVLAQEMVQDASRMVRVPCPVSDLMLGLKCGSSDTT